MNSKNTTDVSIFSWSSIFDRFFILINILFGTLFIVYFYKSNRIYFRYCSDGLEITLGWTWLRCTRFAWWAVAFVAPSRRYLLTVFGRWSSSVPYSDCFSRPIYRLRLQFWWSSYHWTGSPRLMDWCCCAKALEIYWDHRWQVNIAL